mmetsp:Transcript_68699/g.84236  ORF Transcript_68699/g.84236 Transcript_68699/m.84236 type:complete len:80 (+) Transcript_68699:6-245(+)
MSKVRAAAPQIQRNDMISLMNHVETVAEEIATKNVTNTKKRNIIYYAAATHLKTLGYDEYYQNTALPAQVLQFARQTFE